MFVCFFLTAALSSVLGKSSLDGSSQKIWAFVGEDVMLPCLFNGTLANNIATVEWSKKGLNPNIVFLYRDGCETYDMKHPGFHYRTSITLTKLNEGNVSLMILNLKLSDSGIYTCMKHWDGDIRIQDTVELLVDSKPKLSVIPAETGAMTVVCEALYWLSEPEIQILNDMGNNVCDKVQQTARDSSGHFNRSCSVTVMSNTNSEMKCVVRQPDTNQTRTTKTYVPAFIHENSKMKELKPENQCVGLIFAVAVESFLLVIGSIVFVWKHCSKCGAQKVPLPTQQSLGKSCNPKENQLLLPCVDEDNNKNATIEEQRQEIAKLKVDLCERDQTISRLTQERDALKAKQSPTCQLDQPMIPLHRSSSTIKPNQGRVSRNTRNLKSPSHNTQPPRSDLPHGDHPNVSVQSSELAHECNHQHQIRRRMSTWPAFPALSADPLSNPSGYASGKKPAQIPRSISVHSSQSGPTTRILRHSPITPTSPLHNNPYSPLAESNEEYLS
ncbi:uncharacterized protein LOC117505477 [Thalassophryne amazonica]|uniref:uncharacterized protein LOC117505477 n=1 Tax=Thalassophryne amazonica TaxID=390379 RepID=UPI001471AD4D|nr:uncharacterized protein LOC117505477 [Thalassophryne amazonica]